jgi:hypothetical protein
VIGMCIELEILKNRAKLERMILENEEYEKILEQSKKLDDYINIRIKQQKAKTS